MDLIYESIDLISETVFKRFNKSYKSSRIFTSINRSKLGLLDLWICMVLKRFDSWCNFQRFVLRIEFVNKKIQKGLICLESFTNPATLQKIHLFSVCSKNFKNFNQIVIKKSSMKVWSLNQFIWSSGGPGVSTFKTWFLELLRISQLSRCPF